jgi:energy-coupling factor transporter transmembrane protein EcfT
MSAVSGLSPSCRLACLALASTACLAAPAVAAMALSLALVRLITREGIGAARLVRESAFLGWLIIFTAAMEGLSFVPGPRLDAAALVDALGYGIRLVAVFMAGRLFYAVTRSSELREAAISFTVFLPRSLREEAGLALYLSLGFLPLVVEEWERSLEAARARAFPRRPGLAACEALLTAYLRRLMLRAVSLPEALRARAWGSGRLAAPRAWKARDFAALAACALAAAAAIAYRLRAG